MTRYKTFQEAVRVPSKYSYGANRADFICSEICNFFLDAFTYYGVDIRSFKSYQTMDVTQRPHYAKIGDFTFYARDLIAKWFNDYLPKDYPKRKAIGLIIINRLKLIVCAAWTIEFALGINIIGEPAGFNSDDWYAKYQSYGINVDEMLKLIEDVYNNKIQ